LKKHYPTIGKISRDVLESALLTECEKNGKEWMKKVEDWAEKDNLARKGKLQVQAALRKEEEEKYWTNEFNKLQVGSHVVYKISRKSDAEFGILKEINGRDDYVVAPVKVRHRFHPDGTKRRPKVYFDREKKSVKIVKQNYFFCLATHN
jgi:hypothetical protein